MWRFRVFFVPLWSEKFRDEGCLFHAGMQAQLRRDVGDRPRAGREGRGTRRRRRRARHRGGKHLLGHGNGRQEMPSADKPSSPSMAVGIYRGNRLLRSASAFRGGGAAGCQRGVRLRPKAARRAVCRAMAPQPRPGRKFSKCGCGGGGAA